MQAIFVKDGVPTYPSHEWEVLEPSGANCTFGNDATTFEVTLHVTNQRALFVLKRGGVAISLAHSQTSAVRIEGRRGCFFDDRKIHGVIDNRVGAPLPYTIQLIDCDCIATCAMLSRLTENASHPLSTPLSSLAIYDPARPETIYIPA